VVTASVPDAVTVLLLRLAATQEVVTTSLRDVVTVLLLRLTAPE